MLADPAGAAPNPKTYFPLVLSQRPLRVEPAAATRVRVVAQHREGQSSSRADRRSRCASSGPEGRWSPLHRHGLRPRRAPQGPGRLRDAPDVRPAGRVAGRGPGPGSEGAVHDPGEPRRRVTVVPGMAAPGAASPTTADTLGVDPICTRDPMCPLHTQSLSTVIGAGKPVAALFATPARCQSAYCAPVLDEFLDVIKGYGDSDRARAHRDLPGPDRDRARADARRLAHRERAVALRRRRRPARSSRASTARSVAPR